MCIRDRTYIVIPLYPHPFCTHPPANATGCLKIAHLRKFCVRSLVDVSHDLEVELHHVSAGNQESKGCCYLWQQTVLLRPEVQHLYLPCPAVWRKNSDKVQPSHLCMKWHGTWLYGVHKMHRDSSSFVWHQPCQCCKYTTSVDIQKCAKKIFTHVELHASTVSLLKSGE